MLVVHALNEVGINVNDDFWRMVVGGVCLVLRRQGDPILVVNGWLRRGLQREEGTTPKKLEKGAKTCNRAAQAEG